MLAVFLNGLNGKNRSKSIVRNIFSVHFFYSGFKISYCVDIAWLLSNARTCALRLEGSYHVLLPNGGLCTSGLFLIND